MSIDWLGEPPQTPLVIHEDASRTIISRNNSPDVPFSYSVNPYRGCYHACAYCYARPSHEQLGFGAGTDFDRHLVIKPRAAELLREAFEKKSWKGELLVFSGVTDCYQPIEATYELTRQLLEVCLEYRNPVAIITKSALIERDIDLLAELNEKAACRVLMSIPFFEPSHARAIEPSVPSPARRIKTIRRLSEAGIEVTVNIAPVIPGLSDEDIPRILEAARDAGATSAGMILVRLPGSVKPVFEARVREAFPNRAEKILNHIAACRGGNTQESRFGARMRGAGTQWQIIAQIFERFHAKYGYGPPSTRPGPSPFTRPKRPAPQMTLDLSS